MSIPQSILHETMELVAVMRASRDLASPPPIFPDSPASNPESPISAGACQTRHRYSNPPVPAMPYSQYMRSPSSCERVPSRSQDKRGYEDPSSTDKHNVLWNCDNCPDHVLSLMLSSPHPELKPCDVHVDSGNAQRHHRGFHPPNAPDGIFGFSAVPTIPATGIWGTVKAQTAAQQHDRSPHPRAAEFAPLANVKRSDVLVRPLGVAAIGGFAGPACSSSHSTPFYIHPNAPHPWLCHARSGIHQTSSDIFPRLRPGGGIESHDLGGFVEPEVVIEERTDATDKNDKDGEKDMSLEVKMDNMMGVEEARQVPSNHMESELGRAVDTPDTKSFESDNESHESRYERNSADEEDLQDSEDDEDAGGALLVNRRGENNSSVSGSDPNSASPRISVGH